MYKTFAKWVGIEHLAMSLGKPVDKLNFQIGLLKRCVFQHRLVPVSYTHLDVYKRQIYVDMAIGNKFIFYIYIFAFGGRCPSRIFIY